MKPACLILLLSKRNKGEWNLYFMCLQGHMVHLGFHFFGQALHKGVHLSSRIFPQQGVLQDPVILKYFGLAYFAFLLNRGNRMPV